MRSLPNIEGNGETLRNGMERLNTSGVDHQCNNVHADKTHQQVGLGSLPRLSVNAINTDDLESMFAKPNISRKKKPWMYKRQDVRLGFYYTHFDPLYDDFMIRVCLETLFDHVIHRIQPKDQNYLRLQTRTECRYPVEYEGKLHVLSGTPDYVLNYSAEEKKAIKLVVVAAKGADFACCSRNTRYTCCGWNQLAAYMSMIHSYRKVHGKKDCVVYGLRTDAIGFWFYRIANNGKITSKVLKARVGPRYIDYDKITGLMASIFKEALIRSPVPRRSTGTEDQTDEKSFWSQSGEISNSN
ncbi:hypothetical protein N7523_006148 [Penicillium sp. IBT 18751x]|nr:hypothetical protein N7523_006148 [Penicillium sp. IBT 18751x]